MKGDVVVLPFPFSDLTATKKRPSLVVAVLQGNDVILSLITSQEDEGLIALKQTDFQHGKLPLDSFIKPARLFTADTAIISYKIGHIKEKTIKKVEGALCTIFTKA